MVIRYKRRQPRRPLFCFTALEILQSILTLGFSHET